MKALLVIDVQNDFLPGGALEVPKGDEVVEVANRLMPRYELVVATKDWHPADHKSFAKSHPGRDAGDTLDLEGVAQTLWPAHCVQHSRGAELAPRLDAERVDHIVLKGADESIDSYSGFFDNARRRATGLEKLLRERGVDEVHIVGLATDYCVKATALDAIDLGFKTVVFTDGVRGVELRPGDSQRAIDEMLRAGVELTANAEVTL